MYNINIYFYKYVYKDMYKYIHIYDFKKHLAYNLALVYGIIWETIVGFVAYTTDIYF